MHFRHAQRSRDQVSSAPRRVQQALEKQLRFLTTNLRHPSLHAKKYDEASNIWQARVTKGWRFYFQIEGDTYVILSVIPHPK